jgi:hypothetical protein
MKTFVVMLLLVALQNPTPSGGKDSQPTQNQAAGIQTNSPATNPPAEFAAAPLPAGDINTPKNQQRAANVSEDRENKPSQDGGPNGAEIVMAITGVIMIGVSFGQLVMYWCQWQAMQKALAQTARISRKQIKHVGEISERELRAYIAVITNAYDLPSLNQGLLFKIPDGFSLIIKNTGQTPAYRVQTHFIWATIKGHNADWPKDRTFKNAKEIDATNPDVKVSIDTLANGQTLQSDCDLAQKEGGISFVQAYAQFLSEERSIFFYGEITYDDIYRRGHRTEFCIRLQKLGNKVNFVVNDTHKEAT